MLGATPKSEHKVTLWLMLRNEDEMVVAEISGSAAPENGLQVFGDIVLLALERRADNAAEAADGLIDALRERVWEGDDVRIKPVLRHQFAQPLLSLCLLLPAPLLRSTAGYQGIFE